jgi:hypothetical protein
MNLNSLIVNRVNTIILGRKGSGKTYALKNLRGRYFISPNLSVEDLKTLTDSKGGLNTQLNSLLNSRRLVLLIDNLHEAQPRKKNLLLQLSEKHTIIAASLFVPRGFEHWHTVKLEPLSERECLKLLKKHGLSLEKKKEIVKKSKGNPGKLIQMADMQSKIGYYKTPGRELNFNSNQLVNYVLSLRYFFMFTRQWQVYSLVSMFAYALLGWNRRRRYYK